MKLPASPPDINGILGNRHGDELMLILRAVATGPAQEGRYRHWHTLRHRTPPEGLTAESWWVAVKMARKAHYRQVPLFDARNVPFQYAMVDPVMERLHCIDRNLSGHIGISETTVSAEVRDRYIVSSLIEEAITSSQLEGAVATRQVAKQMIKSGRPARDVSERMILNNFRAMELLRNRINEPLTPDLITDLHRILTLDTQEPGQTTFRKTGDGIAVFSDTDVLLPRPPAASEITERLDRLCAFANAESEASFLHPVIKAIILHFMLAYDHPFTDGNGRTARALFYWLMLKENFWLVEYLSISSVLKRAPAQYGRSFLYTETDDNDLTYFILAQLQVIEQAIRSLNDYLARKASELKETRQLVNANLFNHRQTALLGHAQRHPGFRYTVLSHQTSHRVVYATARADLLDLAQRGLLILKKEGKKFVFQAPSDVIKRLRSM